MNGELNDRYGSSVVPEDVMDRARSVVEDTNATNKVEIIARAIMAERERCAKVVLLGHFVPTMREAFLLADAIRAGS